MEELNLKNTQTFNHEEPEAQSIEAPGTHKVRYAEIKELKEYFSTEEAAAIKKELEFMASPEGRAQRLLDDEMSRI